MQQLYLFINFGHEIPKELRQVSHDLASELPEDHAPAFNSAGGVTQAIMEDEEFDELVERLRELDPKNPIFKEFLPISRFYLYYVLIICLIVFLNIYCKRNRILLQT